MSLTGLGDAGGSSVRGGRGAERADGALGEEEGGDGHRLDVWLNQLLISPFQGPMKFLWIDSVIPVWPDWRPAFCLTLMLICGRESTSIPEHDVETTQFASMDVSLPL